eukprot:CAMPEP_0201580210 /NCGR_PEP_ID=MMETSP0190_2-20130828/39434_1 /ASSEMBLY_ACC=CAM_ASM_000263 /TAXON_ID=37353 /ORGANISM="Rosalina sp." /LENGTH=48 /DNA_ID= /DNA_START= /DNA_END= /DNA_ORIENTATION=
MKLWITRASGSIKSSLTPPDNQQNLNCQQTFYDDIMNELSVWMEVFNT